MSAGYHVVFALPTSSYLRFFEHTIRALAARGRVTLALERISEGDRLHLTGIDDDRLSVMQQPVPARSEWLALSDEVARTLDYLRFAEPAFRHTPWLRERMVKYVPASSKWSHRVRRVPRWAVPLLHGFGRAVDRAVPPDAAQRSFIEGLAPDLVVVSPLLRRGGRAAEQASLVRSARVLGVPVALAVGSWDHLSSKGLIRSELDAVLVWNAIQREEAIRFHDVRGDRIFLTGALPFDPWFEMKPALDRCAFCARVGLTPGRLLLCYVGSSPNISPFAAEVTFVREWLSRLRAAGEPMTDAAVLIRPHPGNVESWMQVDLGDGSRTVIWPRRRPEFPMNPDEAADYFHSLHHADLIVGVNTSAMVEAAVAGTPVCTIETEHFAATQGGTVHFNYLLADQGGWALRASDFDSHFTQMRGVLDGQIAVPDREAFLRRFVRPHGLTRRASEVMADVLEGLAGGPRVRGAGPGLASSLLQPLVAWHANRG